MSSSIISQNHVPGIFLLTKNVTKLLHPPGVDCPSFPWTFLGNPGDGAKSYPKAKNLLISLIRKIPLNRFKSFAVKSFISSPIKQQFLSNNPMQSSFVAAVIFVVLYFKFQAFVHTCHANLTNQCFLNVAFSMTKALNDWSSPKKSFHALHLPIPSLLPMLLRKPCFYYCLFSSFSHSLFYLNFIKFQLTSLQLGICGFVS